MRERRRNERKRRVTQAGVIACAAVLVQETEKKAVQEELRKPFKGSKGLESCSAGLHRARSG